MDADERSASSSSSPSRQGPESRQQSVEYGQEDTELNTANGSEYGDDFEESTLHADDLHIRLSNATSHLAKKPFLGLDETGDTPLETSKAPSQDGDEDVEESPADVDRRLLEKWNLHEARKLTDDYGGEKEGLDELWKKHFGNLERPKAYTAESVPKGEFLPMTDPDTIVNMLKDPDSKTTEELYALAANVANILKSWQDEHIAIGELLEKHTRKPKVKYPKYLGPEDPVIYEDKKEAMLYGYPHAKDPKKGAPSERKRGFQDAFLQGGFKPTPAQLKKMEEEAGDTNNVDGWDPIVRDGTPMIPAMRSLEYERSKKVAPPTYNTSGVGWMGMTKKKKKKGQADADETDAEIEKMPKRQTRSNVGKEKETVTPAETTEEPAEPPETVKPEETQTAPPSPPRRGRPRAAAKPRGRPAAASRRATKMARVTKAEPSPNPPPTPPVPAATPHPTSDPGPDPAPVPKKPTRRKRAPATPKAAPDEKPAPSTESASTDKVDVPFEFDDDDDRWLTADQLKKIAESDNPARTRAMMLHWVRFRMDGRQRKPKRTKAEIEADRAAAAQNGGSPAPKKGTETKRTPGKPGRPKANPGNVTPAPEPPTTSGNHQDARQSQPVGRPVGEQLPPTNVGFAPINPGQASVPPGNMMVGQYGQHPPGGHPGAR